MGRIYLNNDWRFAFDFNSTESESVRIPHSVKETPFNYFSEDEYQTVSRYEREIFAPDEWRGERILITFEGVAHYAEVTFRCDNLKFIAKVRIYRVYFCG